MAEDACQEGHPGASEPRPRSFATMIPDSINPPVPEFFGASKECGCLISSFAGVFPTAVFSIHQLNLMKTKLTLLLTAVTFTGVVPLATAGPDLQTQNWRKQIADSHRVAARRVEVSSYVTENNSKANPRPVASNEQGTTNIAVFKSKKK
jgi:hypothetical protein